MPPKKKQNPPGEPCPICCLAVSTKDEALLCVGRCQQRLHRSCASIPEQQFKILCENNTPFLCPSCYREEHEEQFKELKRTVEALRAEVSQLNEQLHKVQTSQVKKSTSSNHVVNNTYAAVAGARVRSPSAQRDNDVRQRPKGSRGWQTVLLRRPVGKQRPPDEPHPSSPPPHGHRDLVERGYEYLVFARSGAP